MATTTTGLVDARIVVNAYGMPAGGVWPHFRLLIDGVGAGQATVSAANPAAYSFTAPVAAGQAHTVQVYYDNDASINGEDRNLGIKSVVVNGNTLSPTQAVYDRYALDGQDTVAGQEGMWWQGALNFSTPAAYYPATAATTPTPTAGSSTIVVNASGTPAGGVGAHFNLLIDGQKIGEGMTTTTAKDFAFTSAVALDAAHKVQVQYDNDAYINGQDRSLLVNAVTINGKAVAPTDPIVTYDKGALDGKDVVAGQSGLWWNGTLVVAADKSYFPSAGTPAPTPTPTTGASTITVNALGNPAAGVNAHFNVLVDGMKIGEGTAATTAKDFAFTSDAATGVGHKVQVQYDNDAYINGQDRSLVVNKITVNGHGYAPTDPAVTYDKGALDGKDVVAGQSGMWWNGTLVVNAPAGDFPATTTPPTTTPPTGPAFYVATNGKDSWSGKLAAPNADGTDGPFATLQAAQQAMRNSTTDVTYVRGGDYYMKDQIWLDSQDSGVRFSAYGAEKPVFHGGTLVDTWVSRGNGLWSAQLPAGAKPVLDLSMDGERQTVARTPNADPTHPIDGGWLIASKSATGTDPTTQITFKPGDIPTTTSASGLMVSAFGQHGYDDVLVPVKSIDFTKNVITLAQGTWDGFGEGSRYYLYNSKDQLDANKEWFYDAGSNQILFRPEGGTPVGHKIVASQLNVLFGMGGAKNVTIDGLTLADGGPNGHGVYAQGADGLTFTNNVVKNTGYGITVQTSPNAKVTGNSFDHTGLEAVFVKMGSNFADVSNNKVEYAGSVDHGSDGIWINGSSDVKVSHNLVEHTAGKAIAVGSVQTTGDETYRATVTYNKVVDSNRETSDGGGIYLINRQQSATGDLVAYNDVSGTSAFGNVKWDGSVSPTWLDPKQLVSWGVYLDDWTSGATVKGNYVHGNLGGVFLHGGWNNQVSNNIIAGNEGREIGLQQNVGYGGWKGTPMSGNDIHHNVVDAASSHGLTVAIDGPKTAGTFHDNDYANLAPNAQLFQVWPQVMAGTTGTLGNWQAAGYDQNSLALNPQFTNPGAGDYSLLAGSPVYQHGFEPIPMDQFGPMA
ncbi:carbohydrate-binding domain-containing protein [Azospirillum sp. sgz301742]